MNTRIEIYPTTARFFHWTIALMIFFNLISGVIMAYFPDLSHEFEIFSIHKQAGAMILVLAILRLIWRLTHKYPSLVGLLPRNERILASLGHAILYILMFALPLSGILFSQSFGKSVYLGMFKLPQLISPQPIETAFQFFAFHKYLAIFITVIILGHVLAALKHHFIDKNEVLLRMLPLNKKK